MQTKEPDGPPPPYEPPIMTKTSYFVSWDHVPWRSIALLIGFACLALSVFASKGGYNPTLPTAICLPLVWWGLTGRPDQVDLHFMRYRNRLLSVHH